MISSSRIASIRSIRDANEARIEAKKLEMDTKVMEDRLSAVRMSVLRDQQQLELERSQMHNGHRWKSSRKGHGKAELKSETKKVIDNQRNENTKKANHLQRSENVRKWNHCDIQNWLTQIGMEEYGAAFEFNNVTGAILLKLENQDLAHLGMETPSARDRMLKAIKALRYGKATYAKDTENAKRTQRETLEDTPSRIHWSHTAPMAGAASEHQTFVNSADAEDVGHSSYVNRVLEWKGQEVNAPPEDTFWINPAYKVTNGELTKGTLNEEKEHEAFRAAVLAWRTASRPGNNPAVVYERKEKESSANFGNKSCWQCYRVGIAGAMMEDPISKKRFCSAACRDLYRKECAHLMDRRSKANDSELDPAGQKVPI